MKTIPITKYRIRFRRWSRKKYSIFCSIGKRVTIGNVKKEITELALTKQKKSLQTTEKTLSFRSEFTEEATSDFPETILNRWLEVLFSYLVIEYSYTPCQVINMKEPNISQPDEYPVVFTRLFLCIHQNKNTSIC